MWMKALIIAGLLTAVVAGAIPLLSDNLGSDVTESLMTHTVRRGDLKVTVTENGMLESSQNEEIKCMVKGGTTVLWVIETGTFVEPGDELVRLDDALIIENITQQQITYDLTKRTRISTTPASKRTNTIQSRKRTVRKARRKKIKLHPTVDKKMDLYLAGLGGKFKVYAVVIIIT